MEKQTQFTNNFVEFRSFKVDSAGVAVYRDINSINNQNIIRIYKTPQWKVEATLPGNVDIDQIGWRKIEITKYIRNGKEHESNQKNGDILTEEKLELETTNKNNLELNKRYIIMYNVLVKD